MCGTSPETIIPSSHLTPYTYVAIFAVPHGTYIQTCKGPFDAVFSITNEIEMLEHTEFQGACGA